MSRKKRKRRKQKQPSARKSSTKKNLVLRRSQLDIDGQLDKAIKYHSSGQLQKAKKIYKKILKIDPNHSESLDYLGLIAHKSGKTDIAENFIEKAIENDPEQPVYYNDLGNVLKDQGKLSEALACYQKVLQLKPDLLDLIGAYYNMANVLKDQGKLSEAIECYQKVLQLKPESAEAYYNMGNAFQYQGKLSEAIECYQKVLQLKPESAETYYNMGNAFQYQGEASKAMSCYEQAIQLKHDYAEVYTDLISQLQLICAWQKLKGLTQELKRLTKRALDVGIRSPDHPFVNVTIHPDPSRNFAVAKSWSSDIARGVSRLAISFSFDDRKMCKKTITVGYLSNDFQNHPVGHLMLRLFGLHNRDEFQVFCYSYGEDDGSSYREEIRQSCDSFVDIKNLNHDDAARRIFKDKIDILVDLKGHTAGNRLAICALRPAPIQVSFLGFPGTTGADFIDYIITDKTVTPEYHAPYYSESFVFMPHCFMVGDQSQAIPTKDWEKVDFGLPENSFVFASFNQPYKIDPTMFNVWMNILQKVPESILWLKQSSETAEKNLRKEAHERGVRPERLMFSDKLPLKGEHLARLKLTDLALDTRIYNGHTTTSDALWAGVPVITKEGSHFASRVSSSLLRAIGLFELIVSSPEEYEALAVELAHDTGKLESIRQKLAENRLTHPLFDTARFLRNLEQGYKEMWRIFVSGEKPRLIEVAEN